MTDATQQVENASLRERYVALREWMQNLPLSVIQLALRITVGSVFFKAGLMKYNSREMTLMLFRDEYKVPLLDPATAATLAMWQELIIPIFLFLGLATRVATIPLMGMIAVIQIFVYPGAWSEHFLWLAALTLLLTRGPGALSLDHLIERYFEGKRPARLSGHAQLT